MASMINVQGKYAGGCNTVRNTTINALQQPTLYQLMFLVWITHAYCMGACLLGIIVAKLALFRVVQLV
jgi:hypothetical protein